MWRWPSASKWREWAGRYAPAEAMAVLTAYGGFYAAHWGTGSLGAAGFGASLGENVGFYGWLLFRDWFVSERSLGKVAKDLIIEFGFAEIFDSFLVRPAATIGAVMLFGPMLGVIIGKIAADLVFYTIAITLYERR
jgi:hypothetical protein